MEQLFRKLDKKKQERIINAALHIFSINDFKHALTDDIASKAKISKGSLFQYFKNKIALYMFLYNFSLEQLGKRFDSDFNFQEQDYFQLVHQSILLKIEIYKKYPYLYRFVLKANEELNPEIAREVAKINNRTESKYLNQSHKDIDYSKFKEETDIEYLFKMIDWCGAGIWNDGLKKHHSVDEMYSKAVKMIDFFKEATYKEEYSK